MSKGCGCESGLFKYIKPPLAKMFYAACCVHDDAYDKGGTSAARKNADVELFINICRIISKQQCGVFRLFYYVCIAVLYYVSVRIFGRYYFNYTDK